MPIFEYVCKKCDSHFEQLVLSPEDPAPKCPKCCGNNVKKLISAGNVRPHGIPTGSGGFKPPKCMSCNQSSK
ncbi:MAG: zinc ribbon domain-containing protein [Deltaproteobacteria bacterium]|nr:zinc ribbon domain-containing protein [Deltaproteobacteria bacterium]